MYMAHVSCINRASRPSVILASSTSLQLLNPLQSLLALGPSAANPPSLGALQVLGRDPALVESTGLGTSSDSRAICANNRDLVGRVDLLSSLRGSLSALAALAAPLLLREQSRDPGVVDEVAGAAEGGEEEEVEEDAVELLLVLRFQWGSVFILENLHLRVEPANRRLNNAHRLVVDLARVDLAGGALQHGGEVQAQVLRVHFGRERVGEGLLLAGGDADAVLLRGEVLEDLGLVGLGGERAADDQDLDGLGLLVVDIEDGAGRVAVDELHAEDLCLREGGGDVDVEVGGLLLEGVFDCLFDALDLFDLGVWVSGRRLMFGVDGDDVRTLMLSAS
jgi:hypothetical protein